MRTETCTLPGEGFGASLIAYEADGFVVVQAGIFVVARWSRGDSVARDVFLVAGHLNGLKSKTLAQLAFCSEAHVSRTLARYERGGTAALLTRGRPGRKPTMTAALRAKAAALRAKGQDLRTIAKTIQVGLGTVARELKGSSTPPPVQPELPGSAAPSPELAPSAAASDADTTTEGIAEAVSSAPSAASTAEPPTPDAPPPTTPESTAVVAPDDARVGGEPLRPGEPLAPTGAPHPCRYAGTLVAVGALMGLGLEGAMERATVRRPDGAVYTATQALLALSAAWVSGFGSLEAMHERDARALGVVLGLERSPSVRTLWRAVAQVTATYDPVQWWAGWMVAMAQTCAPALPIWGVDGHFKAYAGEEPIDKGYNTKRRLAERGLATVRVMDLHGVTWSDLPVRAGDGLREHLLTTAFALRAAEETARAEKAATPPPRPIVLAFDRGGFDFDVLNALAAAQVFYLAWVPASVSLPSLETLAPPDDGVSAHAWTHPRLEHSAALLVQRDGRVVVPATTNLPVFDAAQTLTLLRRARGMEENGIKAARKFVPIDHLDDRGAVGHRPDDRLVRNPARTEQEALIRLLERTERSLRQEQPVFPERIKADIRRDLLVNEVHQQVAREELAKRPKRVARVQLDPAAQRAELDVRNRQLLLPLKNATENARRWLLGALGEGLSPSAHAWDQATRSRTLDALLKAPGLVRFHPDAVAVTLELPLAPTPHARLTAALVALDDRKLRAPDGRALRVRLAPRPTRDDIARDSHETPT